MIPKLELISALDLREIKLAQMIDNVMLVYSDTEQRERQTDTARPSPT